MACSVASSCYLFTRCKWSSLWSNVLPTSVGVVIGLKDNTQTDRHRQTQADTATHSEQQVSIAILLPHPYAMRCARLNSICCIVGTSLAILLWICLPCCCMQLSQPLRSNNATTTVVITVARVHGFVGVSCVIFVSFRHIKIINFTIHNFICHNSSSFYISVEAVALSISSQKTHFNCLMSAEICFDLRKRATL